MSDQPIDDQPIYVVTVQHSTGHGPMVSVALVTHSLPLAVNCARNAKDMAYEFNTDDGATVSKMVPGVVQDGPRRGLRSHARRPHASARQPHQPGLAVLLDDQEP